MHAVEKTRDLTGQASQGVRVVGGPLLLADHTHLLVDETRLVEGQLAPVGVQNFQAVKGLVENQSMEVDFQFYKLPIHCNHPTKLQLL